MNRSEVKGTLRASSMALLRARQALLEAVQDQDVMLTPSDMTEMRHVVREDTVFLQDIKKVLAKFGEVAEARKVMTV